MDGQGKVNWNGPLTMKSFLVSSSAMIALLAGLATLHATIVVPSIMADTKDIVDRKIGSHSETIHQDSVSYREFQEIKFLMLERFDRIDSRLDRMEEK